MVVFRLVMRSTHSSIWNLLVSPRRNDAFISLKVRDWVLIQITSQGLEVKATTLQKVVMGQCSSSWRKGGFPVMAFTHCWIVWIGSTFILSGYTFSNGILIFHDVH